MKRFFSYNYQNEFELHNTLAEAKAAAEKVFEYCRSEARSEGWPESVDEICYGELRGHVVELLCEPWDTNKHGAAPEEGCDYAEYALQDLPHNTGGNALAADLEAALVDAERWRFVRRKLCLTGNGNGTCGMQALNLPAAIPGWPEPGKVAEFCDAAIDQAIKEQS